nr:PREDICTED: porimin [Rhinolophus sinicus]
MGYFSKTSFRAEHSPACSVSGEALVLAFIREKKTAISEKKGNRSSVLGSQARLGGGGGKRSHRAKNRKPRPRVPASPRPAATARCATPAPGPAPAPYLVSGGRWLEERRERWRGLPAGLGAQKGCFRWRNRHHGWRPTRPPHPALRTMGLGARGGLAFFIVGALLVLALLKVAVDSEDSGGSSSGNPSVLVENPTTEPTGNTTHVPASHTDESSKSTVKPSTIPVSSVSKNGTVTTSKPTTKPSTTSVSSASKNGTVTTLKPVTSKKTTTQVSTNVTSTTLKSTTKVTSLSQNTTQMSTSTMTTTHNSSVTSAASSGTITATVNSKDNKGSKFDIGSFVGGIALTLGILSVLYIGCKTYYSRRGIRYRTIDEHDAII